MSLTLLALIIILTLTLTVMKGGMDGGSGGTGRVGAASRVRNASSRTQLKQICIGVVVEPNSPLVALV